MEIIVVPTVLGWLRTLNERRNTNSLAQGWHTLRTQQRYLLCVMLSLDSIWNKCSWKEEKIKGGKEKRERNTATSCRDGL